MLLLYFPLQRHTPRRLPAAAAAGPETLTSTPAGGSFSSASGLPQRSAGCNGISLAPSARATAQRREPPAGASAPGPYLAGSVKKWTRSPGPWSVNDPMVWPSAVTSRQPPMEHGEWNVRPLTA